MDVGQDIPVAPVAQRFPSTLQLMQQHNRVMNPNAMMYMAGVPPPEAGVILKVPENQRAFYMFATTVHVSADAPNSLALLLVMHRW